MKTMDLTVGPLAPFGAEISGIDLSQELGEDVKEQLREAWRTHALLLFRNQEISKEDQLRAAAIFGNILIQGEAPGGINFVTNVAAKRGISEDGEFNLYSQGEMQFHIDHSFHVKQPQGLMLYGIEVTKTGGETLFSDSRLALSSLPASLRERVGSLTVRHAHRLGAKGTVGDAGWPGYSDHPMVRRHDRSGRDFLFLSRRHSPTIHGMDGEEGEKFMDELYEYIAKRENVYTHSWKPNDLVLWDNVALQHARNDYDPNERRHLRKAQFA